MILTGTIENLTDEPLLIIIPATSIPFVPPFPADAGHLWGWFDGIWPIFTGRPWAALVTRVSLAVNLELKFEGCMNLLRIWLRILDDDITCMSHPDLWSLLLNSKDSADCGHRGHDFFGVPSAWDASSSPRRRLGGLQVWTRSPEPRGP